jgi:hypothetical protein
MAVAVATPATAKAETARQPTRLRMERDISLPFERLVGAGQC